MNAFFLVYVWLSTLNELAMDDLGDTEGRSRPKKKNERGAVTEEMWLWLLMCLYCCYLLVEDKKQ